MQYMLICCFEESRWQALPAAEREQIMRDYGAFIQQHVASGQYLAGGKLHDSPTAVRVQQQQGKPQVLDGPFAETKEQIGGYHIIDCADQAEAVAIAQRIPTLPAGGLVEVRPLVETH